MIPKAAEQPTALESCIGRYQPLGLEDCSALREFRIGGTRGARPYSVGRRARPVLSVEGSVMDKPQSILVIVDPEQLASPAVSKARILAAAFDAAVELLLCDTRPAYSADIYPDAESLTALTAAVEAKHTVALDRLATPLRDAKIKVTTRVEFGNPLHAVILGRVDVARPGLVIKDTHHHSVIRRTIVTNTDWQLLRSCAAPLLLVKAREWPREPRVIAAVASSHPGDPPDYLTHAVIDLSALLARALGSHVELLHAWSPIPVLAQSVGAGMPGGGALAIPQELLANVRRIDRDRFEHLARVHNVRAPDIHYIEGAPVEALPAFAESRVADIMTMGVISRSALDRLFVGNTAERVLERMPCDILAVKTQPSAAALELRKIGPARLQSA
jgi:universal stress protein E